MTNSRSLLNHIALITALSLAACNSAGKKETEPKKTAEPKATVVEALPEGESYNRANITHFDRLMSVYKKDKKERFERPAQSFPVSISPLTSVNYVVISGKVKPHKHVDHDEVFIVVAGEGVLSVESRDGGIETHEVTAGSIFHIPRGVAHAYQNVSAEGQETLGLSVFTPAYTEPDRVPVTWSKKKDKPEPGN